MLPGGRVAWWRDATGDERGLLMAMPFAGGRAEPVFPDPAGRVAHGALVRSRVGRRSRWRSDGAYRTYVIERDGTARVLADHEAAAGVGSLEPGLGGGLSADGALAVHPARRARRPPACALRVLDTRTGEVVGELEDKGRNLDPVAWSPVSGDQRLAFTSELGAFERPAIWDVRRRRPTRPGHRPAERGLPRAMVAPRRRAPRPPRTRGPRAARADRPRDRRDRDSTGLDGDIDGAGIRPGRVGLVLA